MKLTINEISQPDFEFKPVWVLNKSRGRNRGVILIGCPKVRGSGDADQIRIPNTFLPTDMTTSVPRDQLLASSDFRQAVTKGLIELIDDSEAKAILSKPGASEELTKLSRPQHEVSAERIEEELANPIKTAKVQVLLSRIGELGEVGVINTLRTMEEDIDVGEYTGIKAEALTKGFKRLVKYVDNRLAEIS